MWSLVDNLAYHGVLNATPQTLLQNPYFAKVGGTYHSKITGYGIKYKGFYLSVPECYTTSLARIPIIQGTPTTWANHVFTQAADVTHLKLTSCDETVGVYRDLYLEGLRDMMSASSMAVQTSYTNNTGTGPGTVAVEEVDRKARYAKGHILNADYNGLSGISYKRLEISGEVAKSCLFKIPKQIIYYNKYALAWASTTNTGPDTTDSPSANWPNKDGSGSSLLSKQTAFTGPGKLKYPSPANPNSTTTSSGIGNLYKADELWSNWCSNWSTTLGESSFNEADIEWQLKGMLS